MMSDEKVLVAIARLEEKVSAVQKDIAKGNERIEQRLDAEHEACHEIRNDHEERIRKQEKISALRAGATAVIVFIVGALGLDKVYHFFQQ